MENIVNFSIILLFVLCALRIIILTKIKGFDFTHRNVYFLRIINDYSNKKDSEIMKIKFANRIVYISYVIIFVDVILTIIFKIKNIP